MQALWYICLVGMGSSTDLWALCRFPSTVWLLKYFYDTSLGLKFVSIYVLRTSSSYFNRINDPGTRKRELVGQPRNACINGRYDLPFDLDKLLHSPRLEVQHVLSLLRAKLHGTDYVSCGTVW